MHGDLGMVMPGDVVIAISNSGETQELNALVPVFRQRNVPIIAFTGKPDSTLGRNSTFVIDTGVEKEACSLGLAPTASTTAALAVGDALAVVLLKLRRFSEKDFMRNHPCGTLGERLRVSVSEVMFTGEDVPIVKTGALMDNVIKEIDRKRLGAALVLDSSGCLRGIVTDGDLRRAMLKFGDMKGMQVDQVMTKNPKSIMPDALAAEALALMETHLITVLPVVGTDGRLSGIIHLHDLLGKGQFKFVV
jgi:arabinose-5-phosphate isomerase